MNKFAAIALFALVAGLAAAADVDVEKETGLLLGNEKLFASYCLDERAKIVSDIKSRAGEQSSALFNIFFGAANEIADEVLNVEKQAIEELSRQIQDSSSAPVSDEPLPEDQVQALIEAGKREIQQKGAIGRLVAATQTAGQVMINTANSAIFVRLAKARAVMNAGTLLKGFFNTCKQVAEYEKTLEADLEQAKGQLVSENGEQEIQDFIRSVSVPSLKCYTTKFISRLNAFCDVVKKGSGPFFKMLGVSPKVAAVVEANKV